MVLAKGIGIVVVGVVDVVLLVAVGKRRWKDHVLTIPETLDGTAACMNGPVFTVWM